MVQKILRYLFVFTQSTNVTDRWTVRHRMMAKAVLA